MFGKHFASMYERSMVGAGAMVFAVMGYVIANCKPDHEHGGKVALNPTILAGVFGEKAEDVQKAIDFLCSPDEQSHSKEEGGRRLIQLSAFEYRVVNFQKYRALKNADKRREQNRINQAAWRQRKKPETGVADVNARANGYVPPKEPEQTIPF